MNTLCTDCLYLLLTGGTGTAGGAGSVGGTTIGTGSSTGGSKSGSGGQSNNASSSSNSNEHASNYINSSNLPARGVIDVNLATRTGKVQDTNLICCSSRFKTLFFDAYTRSHSSSHRLYSILSVFFHPLLLLFLLLVLLPSLPLFPLSFSSFSPYFISLLFISSSLLLLSLSFPPHSL
jgi:hypothetical protein